MSPLSPVCETWNIDTCFPRYSELGNSSTTTAAINSEEATKRRHARKYITDLKLWEVPRVDDLAERVVEELMAKPPRGIDRRRLGEDLLDRLLPRLRVLAQTVISETIEYWNAGLVTA